MLQNQGQKIALLENELSNLRGENKQFTNISQEALLLFPELKTIAHAANVTRRFDTQKLDTVDVFTVSYKVRSKGAVEKLAINKRLGDWLRYRIQSDSVMVQTVRASGSGI
jgi:hypothetical protein